MTQVLRNITLLILCLLDLFAYSSLYGIQGARTAARAASGSLIPTDSLTTPRASHTATLLPNGKVLIAGGFAREGTYFASAELYDPASGSFAPTGSMAAARVGHTATLLPNGKVLVAGGFGNGYLASAELYDPASGTFSPTGSTSVRHDAFTATLLPNGKVLVAGGYDGNWHAEAELYDPATGRFTPTGRLNIARSIHTATLLPNGKVLLTGGGSGRSTVIASAELYDPVTGTFALTGNLTRVRYKHAATLLPDGSVLILGGSDNRDWDGRYASAEIYQPATGAFTSTSSMNSTRFKFPDAVVLLRNGELVVAGAGEQIETYNPVTSAFNTAEGRMDAARYYMTATLLADGRVLVAGGYNRAIVPSASAWLYDDPNARNLISVVSAASKTASGVAITYTGTLQAADKVNGPYADVAGATSPYSAATTGAAKFFRARK